VVQLRYWQSYIGKRDYENSILHGRLQPKTAAQHGVHADGWILTAKLAFFVALGFVRFVGESRPSSRR
jgi:hypothetical protein